MSEAFCCIITLMINPNFNFRRICPIETQWPRVDEVRINRPETQLRGKFCGRRNDRLWKTNFEEWRRPARSISEWTGEKRETNPFCDPQKLAYFLSRIFQSKQKPYSFHST